MWELWVSSWPTLRPDQHIAMAVVFVSLAAMLWAVWFVAWLQENVEP